MPESEDENIVDISIEGAMEEVGKIPRRIIAFCNEKKVDSGKANLLAVAVEEMLANIIRYGGRKVCRIRRV